MEEEADEEREEEEGEEEERSRRRRRRRRSWSKPSLRAPAFVDCILYHVIESHYLRTMFKTGEVRIKFMISSICLGTPRAILKHAQNLRPGGAV